mmetsp:Transcript_74748/g.132026  ORF Transcript_74748/g.132026 Transcript_74748/m.132026 type:complete len:234 (-) Transcript_74748:116-817(-)
MVEPVLSPKHHANNHTCKDQNVSEIDLEQGVSLTGILIGRFHNVDIFVHQPGPFLCLLVSNLHSNPVDWFVSRNEGLMGERDCANTTHHFCVFVVCLCQAFPTIRRLGAFGAVQGGPGTAQRALVLFLFRPIDLANIRLIIQFEDIDMKWRDLIANLSLVTGEFGATEQLHGEEEVLIPIAEVGRFVVNGVPVDQELHGCHWRINVVFIPPEPTLAVPLEDLWWGENAGDEDQ